MPAISVYIREKNYEKLKKLSFKTGKSVGRLIILLVEHAKNEPLESEKIEKKGEVREMLP